MRTAEGLKQDIRYYLGIYLRRARGAHRRYLDAARRTRTPHNFAALFDTESAYYTERGEMLEMCRALKNLLNDSTRQRPLWTSNLYKARDRRWKRERDERWQ